MTFDQSVALLRLQERPVILLEGTRKVPTADSQRLSRFGEQIARLLPHAHFRSGNAPGADQAFAAGVCRVRPASIQCVGPRQSHRVQERTAGANAFSLDQVPDAELAALMETTLDASPGYRGLINLYQRQRKWDRHTIKLAYLLRDTLKVVGSPTLDLTPATFGIFYVNKANPDSGGTGHTIRVCRVCGVPVVYQNTWLG